MGGGGGYWGLPHTPVTGLIGKHLAPGNQSPAIPHIPPNTHARFPWQLWWWRQGEWFGLQSEPDCSDDGRGGWGWWGGFAVAAPLLHGRQRERAEVKFNKRMSLCTGGALHQIRGAARKTDTSVATLGGGVKPQPPCSKVFFMLTSGSINRENIWIVLIGVICPQHMKAETFSCVILHLRPFLIYQRRNKYKIQFRKMNTCTYTKLKRIIQAISKLESVS